jgi:predicted small metal-binding protein
MLVPSPDRRSTMGKRIDCECGEVVKAATDDELVAKVDEHVRSDHPELVGKLSRDDVLAMAVEDE